MILKLSKDKKLTFYRKNPIYIGEKDFNTIEVLISPTIDGNETNELNFILHLVNKDGEYLHIDLDKEIKEDIIVGSTQITTDITSVAQKFSVYIEMVRGNNEIIGKTNVLEIEVNPLPDEQGEIIPEEIERRSTIISQDNPPESSHKKYKLNALWINYTDKTQFVLTSINESQAPEKYVYTWERNNNHVVVSTETVPEYTPNNVDYKYSNGDIWVQTDLETNKIVSISVCTGYTKELIDNETWRYDYTWAILNSGVTNYNELNNKPQINNITLQGNKTSDDLNLQDKLTAGQNITISEDNVISAEGGLSDYTSLENKPSINNVTLSGNKSSDDLNLQGKLTAGNNITINNGVISANGGITSYNDLTDKPKLYLRVGGSNPSIEPTEVDISNVFTFLWNEIYLTRSENGYAVNFNIPFNGLAENKKYFHSQTEWDKYNFNSLSTRQKNGIWDLNVKKCLNTPQFIIDCFVGRYNLNFFIMHFLTDYYVIRVVAGEDVNNDLRIFSQYLTTNPTTGAVTSQTDWVELTGGGAQIVSGVVNANGTITFTDSDGNTFTTSGSSVIGADGFSPVATVTQTASGATVSITDSTGTTTANIANGQNGNDYVLTAQDKSDIADIVLSELPTTQGVLYGNTSN